METHVDTVANGNPHVAELVRGIVHDAHDLVEEQFKLFQIEIKDYVKRSREAVIPLLAGILIGMVGAVSLAAGGGLVLSWAWPSLPLWGAFAIVGGTLLLVGILLGSYGKCKLEACDEARSHGDAAKENIPWKMKK